jgi:excisionase family DNA binding protein
MFAEYDDLIDIETLMDMLCIGRNKAYELVNSKEIAACKVGKSWKIPKKNVIDFLEKECGNRS